MRKYLVACGRRVVSSAGGKPLTGLACLPEVRRDTGTEEYPLLRCEAAARGFSERSHSNRHKTVMHTFHTTQQRSG